MILQPKLCLHTRRHCGKPIVLSFGRFFSSCFIYSFVIMTTHDSSKADDTKLETKPFPPRINEHALKPTIYENELYTYVFEPFEDHMKKLKIFEIRRDDVWLYTYPKSGTHWMFRVLDMLMIGKAECRDFHVDQVSVDNQLLEDMDRLPSPRLLLSQLSKKWLPSQIMKKNPKIIHVYRNPKAIAVSLYRFLSDFDHFKTVLSMEMSVKTVIKNWTEFVDGVSELMRDYPDLQIFNISYEEMSENLHQTVKDLAAFLGIAASDDLCRQIQDACSFDKQKSVEDKLNAQANIHANTYRQGVNDSWKKDMTVAQSEEFDDMLRQRKDVCRFSAKYI